VSEKEAERRRDETNRRIAGTGKQAVFVRRRPPNREDVGAVTCKKRRWVIAQREDEGERTRVDDLAQAVVQRRRNHLLSVVKRRTINTRFPDADSARNIGRMVSRCLVKERRV
jgi:hypothetical protein